MDDLSHQSPDLTQTNIEKLCTLFPEVQTEMRDKQGNPKKAIDFDRLKQLLSDDIIEGADERYQLDWPGKKAAMLKADIPIRKTLRPCRKESVNFDTTKNIFIEGDNFEALKLIQESYLGKIKMIYIDPPYNTGQDFIYKDKYQSSKDAYLQKINYKDENAHKLVKNPDTNGRFHSDWLSMMYPRLKIARDLLKEDGVIFISIDDNEVHNLRLIMNEIFGEENFEGHIHWRRRYNQPNDSTKMIGLVAEHILSYAKDSKKYKEAGVGKIGLTGSFSNPDNDPRGDWASKPWKVGSDQSGSRYKIVLPSGDVLDSEWMGEEGTFKKLLKDNRIIFPENGKGAPRKKYFKFEREAEGQCATNWWYHKQFGHNQEGNDTLTELMNDIKNTFSNPKPLRLIDNLISIANCKKNDIVLDFFAGSGATAHASFKHEEDIRSITVQLPETLDNTNKVHKPAIEFCELNNIKKLLTELTKERIRRAGKKIIEECEAKNKALKPGEKAIDTSKLDLGFRVYKIDSPHLNDVDKTPSETTQEQLTLLEDPFKSDRGPDDLLTHLLLKYNLELSDSIKKIQLQGQILYAVQGNYLLACFDEAISEALIDEIVKRKPMRVVFLDRCFKQGAHQLAFPDQNLINTKEKLKTALPNTTVEIL